jgi:hypothetical protein
MKKISLLCILVICLSNCKSIDYSKNKESKPSFQLKNCYHYWYGIEDSKTNNYITNRVYVEFSALDSSFLWEVCPPETEGIVYYTSGHYTKVKNELALQNRSANQSAQLRIAPTIGLSIADTKQSLIYVPFETDSIWVRNSSNGEIILATLKDTSIDKIVYKDSIFLEQNKAFTAPSINLAPVIDNYYYMEEELSKMTRNIQLKSIQLQEASFSICLKIKEQKTSWLAIEKRGTYYLEALLPYELESPIKAELKEDTLSMYKINNKIRATLSFKNSTILGNPNPPSSFHLYSDSCSRCLNKTYVNSK